MPAEEDVKALEMNIERNEDGRNTRPRCALKRIVLLTARSYIGKYLDEDR
jgi:hypothetical protein